MATNIGEYLELLATLIKDLADISVLTKAMNDLPTFQREFKFPSWLQVMIWLQSKERSGCLGLLDMDLRAGLAKITWYVPLFHPLQISSALSK